MHNVIVSSRSSSFSPTICYKPWHSPLWCQAITSVLSDLVCICLYALLFLHVPGAPLARYVKLQDVHGPGMPGTFSPLPRVSDPDMHHGTCVTHLPWCMLGSLTSGFLWRLGKRSRHSRRTHNPQFYVSYFQGFMIKKNVFQWKAIT